MDYVCSIDDIKVGVSVTRALKFRKGFPDDDINRYSGNFTSDDAINLLEKKLNAIKGELRLKMGDFVQKSFLKYINMTVQS